MQTVFQKNKKNNDKKLNDSSFLDPTLPPSELTDIQKPYQQSYTKLITQLLPVRQTLRLESNHPC